MPCCAAVNCSSRGEQSIRMFRFPVNLQRKNLWIKNMCRDKWMPTPCSRLCEKHFESSQYESNRKDGLKKLKPNSIPTLFDIPNPPPKIDPPSGKSKYKMDVKQSKMTDSDFASVWDVDIGLLIRLVKNFPCLYNHNYEEFKNIQLKERTWDKISTNLNIPVNDCQRLWKNLRDKYSRERRSLNGQGFSAWEYYTSMTFLDSFVRRRRRTRKFQTKKCISDDFTKQEIESNDDNSTPMIEVWDDDTVDSSISSKNLPFLEGENYNNGEPEEITLNVINDLPVKEVNHQPEKFVNMIKYQSSEEAFGAYVASRLLDFPVDDRQAKKVKIFKVLEDLDKML